jgi:hypothetical protein
MIRLEPPLSCVPHEIVIHKIVSTDAKNKKITQKYECEFCFKEYAQGGSLGRQKQSHAKHFENSITKYYAIANSCGDSKVLEAINLLKADFLGLETYEVLMDDKLLVRLNNIIYSKCKYSLYVKKYFFSNWSNRESYRLTFALLFFNHFLKTTTIRMGGNNRLNL